MSDRTHDSDRRRLLRAMGATGLLAGFNALLPAYAREGMTRHLNTAAAQVPGGGARDVVMDVHVRREMIDIAGGRASAITLNHTTPGPIVELWEGQNAHLRVHNHLDESTSIHWHGILLPFQMDGVPGVAFPGIDPGETFEVDFPVRQAGTYWYHSHSGLQEQVGQTGPIVIHSANDDGINADREYVIVLNDWTFEDPHRLLAKLKEMSDYYNFSERTLGDLAEDFRQSGVATTLKDRLAWGDMRMSPRDIADVTGHTYSYLMNGVHPDANWTGLFTPGERIRLRVINASAMTYFNVRVPGLPMTVVAADGKEIQPVETDEFQIGVAETFDVVVQPKADQAYTIMAETMDRSGYARGTLAPRVGMVAPVPALREQPQRTMIDMGMDMSQMGMGGMKMSQGKRPKPMGHGQMAMDHGSMQKMDMPKKDSGMAEMSHQGHKMADSKMSGKMAGMGHDMKKMAHGTGPNAGSMGTGAMMEQSGPVIAKHGPDHHGAGNLTVANVQRDRLGERGTGLEDVNHRVLTYSQLRNMVPMRDRREPSRTIEVHLTGNMDRYMWSFDGVKYSNATPIEFPYGERIRLIMVNDTMMEHPIHLHGMFMELENDQGEHLPFKHTLSVLPGSRASLLITADEPGRWAFHCHLLYHMEMGMFRVVRVSDQSGDKNA
ncbi:copper resistance system multicopper oxidase [Salinisphaera japonica]|uniref:Copper-resistance protein CopA n=1 Tax=Salinisphaera japonica YTM-1 TaxID=1209778 RepID=A0A423Q0P0_9GAMM|nr:copper resistance system multicopper oxidase [Salinisphaera japonica]ROO31807.1 copper-resistance protein CopA [Salinisphaera japonica YTM-1]